MFRKVLKIYFFLSFFENIFGPGGSHKKQLRVFFIIVYKRWIINKRKKKGKQFLINPLSMFVRVESLLLYFSFYLLRFWKIRKNNERVRKLKWKNFALFNFSILFVFNFFFFGFCLSTSFFSYNSIFLSWIISIKFTRKNLFFLRECLLIQI